MWRRCPMTNRMTNLISQPQHVTDEVARPQWGSLMQSLQPDLISPRLHVTDVGARLRQPTVGAGRESIAIQIHFTSK